MLEVYRTMIISGLRVFHLAFKSIISTWNVKFSHCSRNNDCLMRAVAVVKPLTSVRLTAIRANTGSHLKAKLNLLFI